VPVEVTIQLVDCGCAGSRPGVIVLDETLLESPPYGPAYTWGLVHHEYAHQIWWYVLDDVERTFLQERLGGTDLCFEQRGLPHDAHTCERFANTLAWAYWPVEGNPVQGERPSGRGSSAGSSGRRSAGSRRRIPGVPTS
jgi:hypothetical protein